MFYKSYLKRYAGSKSLTSPRAAEATCLNGQENRKKNRDRKKRLET